MARSEDAEGWYTCCKLFYVGFGWRSLPACPDCAKRSQKAKRSQVDAAYEAVYGEAPKTYIPTSPTGRMSRDEPEMQFLPKKKKKFIPVPVTVTPKVPKKARKKKPQINKILAKIDYASLEKMVMGLKEPETLEEAYGSPRW